MEPVPPSGVSGLKDDTPGRGGTAPLFDAVVLAGGRASRLGGFPKPQLVYGSKTLLERALDAVHGACVTVVVGPEPAPTPRAAGPVLYALEEPRFGGPVAALSAGLAALGREAARGRAPWVAVLAADLPRAADALAPLLASAAGEPSADAVLAEDENGRSQPLLAVYRREVVERCLKALDEEGGVADRPLRDLVARLAVQSLRLPPGLADDVDTWPAAERWGIRRPEGPGTPSQPEEH